MNEKEKTFENGYFECQGCGDRFEDIAENGLCKGCRDDPPHEEDEEWKIPSYIY